jgi:hypothetical protein
MKLLAIIDDVAPKNYEANIQYVLKNNQLIVALALPLVERQDKLVICSFRKKRNLNDIYMLLIVNTI